MSDYSTLRGLYLGRASNADITDSRSRDFIHVRTELDQAIPEFLAAGRDVILTGNPGDGKSHLARRLADSDVLHGAELELDLSAQDSGEVIQRWKSARAARRPMLLCANEGPLRTILPALRRTEVLRASAEELGAQLGRLCRASESELALSPESLVVVDLADRELMAEATIRDALQKVCQYELMPDVPNSEETMAGFNLLLLSAAGEPRRRLARVLAAAGRLAPRHVTFRELWAAVSYSICRGYSEARLTQMRRQGESGLGWSPLDNLVAGHAQGQLFDALRSQVDPASVTHPELESQLWHDGKPARGQWLDDADDLDEEDPPAARWEAGDRAGALAMHVALKRYVALFHEAGSELVERALDRDRILPSSLGDPELQRRVVDGLRRSFLSVSQQAGAPAWLVEHLPLWVGLSYVDAPAEERPHVATDAALPSELRILRPVRVPWLERALGPMPEVAWLHHTPSRTSLRLTPALLSHLQHAARSSGPLSVPGPVSRFLSRVAGWMEHRPRAEVDHFAVLERPRGALLSTGTVLPADVGATYA